MSTTLTSTCPCGASISAPCEAAEITAVVGSFAAQGWGYRDGYRQCPDCAADPERWARHRTAKSAVTKGSEKR
jgi:hypothetical protein